MIAGDAGWGSCTQETNGSGGTPDHPMRPSSDLSKQLGSAGDDLDLDGGRDVLVQTDLGREVTDGLDRRGQFDLALVDLRTADGHDALGDVGRGDGAEEATAGAGLRRDRDDPGLQGLTDLL